MSNTRKIQPISVWSANGQVQVNCLALNNFFKRQKANERIEGKHFFV